MPRAQSGPPLIVPGAAFAVLTVIGVALGARGPRPTDSAGAVLTYVQQHGTTLRWGSFLALGAAVPLAIWTATAYRRLRALGITAPGSAIALAGGVVAAAMLALSGLCTWVESRTTDAAVAAAVRDAGFITGASGYVAFLGLLVAGVSVPMLLLRIARPWAVLGLVVALVAEISTLVLVSLNLEFTLPIGRFGGLLWLLAVSLVLPASRPRSRVADEPAAVAAQP
jgi:hypothetical protein